MNEGCKFYDNLTTNLVKELFKSKILVVITGISGSGKSTIMKELQDKVSRGSTVFLSVDDFKINTYEKYGFNNLDEKRILADMAVATFKAEVLVHARKGRKVVMEYPFATKWQSFFDYIRDTYGYRLVVVNCRSRSFDDIWNKKLARDSDIIRRHPALVADRFMDMCDYNLGSSESMEILKDVFDSNYYNSIIGDVTYNDNGLVEF